MECLKLKLEPYGRTSTDQPIWLDARVLVDKMVPLAELRYERVDVRGGRGRLYFAEKDGYVSFYADSDDNRGFGGAHIPITLSTGEPVTLRGPWSSSPAVMNRVGFTPSHSISMTDDPAAWEKGWTFFSVHVTVEWLRAALAEHAPDYELADGPSPNDRTAHPHGNHHIRKREGLWYGDLGYVRTEHGWTTRKEHENG